MNIAPGKQQAWALYNNNKLDDAKQICEEIRDIGSADAETFYLLGCCYGQLGQFTDAAEALQNSLQLQPDVPQSLLALGNALTRLGRFEEAVECYRSVIRAKPEMAVAHNALADILCILGATSDALQHYETAIKLRPDMAAAHIGLGTLVGRLESNPEKALLHFQSAIELEPEKPAYRCSMGQALTEARRNEEAFACFREALELAPEFPDAIGGLARLYNMEGEYVKSMEQIDLLRNKNIHNFTAAVAFTNNCKHSNNCEEAVAYAEKNLDSKQLNNRSLESLHMHIARALDSLQRYDEAWLHFGEGNKLTEKLYDTVAHKVRTESMIKVFNQSAKLSFSKSTIDTKRPIFIVGMPRSGTSLVEQILAAHPDVCGGGELTYMSDLRAGILEEAGPGKNWPDCVQELKQEDLNRLATRYLELLNGVSESAKRITDKMPHNFFELGLIQMLFPQAQIIHCNRDPMDTCLSIYFQNFLDGHVYSRNLYNIGTHYHQYLRLMEHWRHYLSIPFMDVQYEDLVHDPKPLVKKILEHCKLEWHDDCLKFYKVKRLVSTASYDQVRQPIYTRSVNRWRHYEKHLADLKEGLDRGF